MFKKHSVKTQNKFEERLGLFMIDQYLPLLHNHALGGEWMGCRSINITGDIRAVFEKTGDDSFEFIAIGSHSKLYS